MRKMILHFKKCKIWTGSETHSVEGIQMCLLCDNNNFQIEQKYPRHIKYKECLMDRF